MFKLFLSNVKSISFLLACIVTSTFPINTSAQQPRSGDQRTRAEGPQEEFSLSLDEQRKLRVANATKSSITMLVNVFNRLAPSQRHNLGPLSQPERRKLIQKEGAVQLREKIGVVRRLPRELQVTRLTAAVVDSSLTAPYAGGRVDVTQDRKLVWTTEISSPGATGIRVRIENINLPPEAMIFVTDGVRQIHGPYSPSRTLLTNTVFGAKVYVQVQIPSDSADQPSNAFTISQIAHLEEKVEARVLRSGRSDNLLAEPLNTLVSCDLEAFCRPANPSPNPSAEDILLETASLGVARLNFQDGDSIYLCSGGLLSDRRSSNTPFFLTANHCFSTQVVADTLEAHWVFRRACGQGAPDLSTVPSTLGSTILATNPDNDFTFVQLSQTPPAGSHFFRWSPEDISNTTTTTYRVHHPLGYSQHMQRSTVQATNVCARDGLPNGPYLLSSQLKGGTNEGSSGSLLFRAEGNTPIVVGQLFGACWWDPPVCGYWNVDGSFAHTFRSVQRFLDDTPVAQRPVINIIRPNHNDSLPANSTIEVVARITGNNEITTAEMYWQRSHLFMGCPSTGQDWSCSKQGDEYKWVLNVSTGNRTFYIRAGDAQGNWNYTPDRTIQLN